MMRTSLLKKAEKLYLLGKCYSITLHQVYSEKKKFFMSFVTGRKKW